MKTSFLILADFHANNYKRNRYDYSAEVYSVADKIHQIAEKERVFTKGEVNAISAGDIVDKSKKSREQYTKVYNQIKYLIKPFDKFYLVFGNHEMTYSRDNPIYAFMKDIQNKQFISLNKKVRPEGLWNEVLTPERISMNGTDILLQSWKTHPELTQSHGIIVMHDDLVSDSAITQNAMFIKERYDVSTQGITHIFSGHVHTVVEEWYYKGAKVYNLGSLLRTNVNEVEDDYRTRYIPILRFDGDGHFSEVVLEQFKLHSRENVVDEIAYQKSHEKTRESMQRKKLTEEINSLQVISLLKEDNPLDIVLETVSDVAVKNLINDIRRSL